MGIWHGLPTYMVDFYGKIVGKYTYHNPMGSVMGIGLDDPFWEGFPMKEQQGCMVNLRDFPLVY